MEFDNIIVRMPNWLGDLVMATPVLEDLRIHFPKSKITAMCTHHLAPLLADHPYVNEVFSFRKPNSFLRRENRDIIWRLKQGKYDLGILLTNSFSSAWWFWRAGIKKRIGFKNEWRNLLLSNALPIPEERGEEHLVVTYKRILLSLGIPLSSTAPKLFISEAEKKAVDEILVEHRVPSERTLIGINPSAAYGPAKCWLPERFREVALRLLENPENYIVFVGDAASRERVSKICQGLPARAINLAGLTKLNELVALIDACDLFLTNDSGPMHIAAAVRTPLLALFGSTNDKATGPYLFGRVIHKRVSCSPCYLRSCPIDFKCMKGIEVEEVTREIKKMLGQL